MLAQDDKLLEATSRARARMLSLPRYVDEKEPTLKNSAKLVRSLEERQLDKIEALVSDEPRGRPWSPTNPTATGRAPRGENVAPASFPSWLRRTLLLSRGVDMTRERLHHVALTVAS